jgi:hypothetical protein
MAQRRRLGRHPQITLINADGLEAGFGGKVLIRYPLITQINADGSEAQAKRISADYAD